MSAPASERCSCNRVRKLCLQLQSTTACYSWPGAAQSVAYLWCRKSQAQPKAMQHNQSLATQLQHKGHHASRYESGTAAAMYHSMCDLQACTRSMQCVHSLYQVKQTKSSLHVAMITRACLLAREERLVSVRQTAPDAAYDDAQTCRSHSKQYPCMHERTRSLQKRQKHSGNSSLDKALPAKPYNEQQAFLQALL
jgi:hypothetical protein